MQFSGEVTPDASASGDLTAVAGSGVVSGLGLSAKGSGGVSLSFSASVVTPFVSAVGLGSTRAEWRFDRYEDALFGRDIETWSILALPKRRRQLRYRIQYNMTTRTFFFPTRTESEWSEVLCTFNF
jgi:hypothetical protein